MINNLQLKTNHYLALSFYTTIFFKHLMVFNSLSSNEFKQNNL